MGAVLAGRVERHHAAGDATVRDPPSCTELSGILYNTGVGTINVSEARENLARVLDEAQSEAVVLERYGRPAAVVVSVERYEQLLDGFEEAQDIAAFDAALAEEGPNIPWEQVRSDLGWR